MSSQRSVFKTFLRDAQASKTLHKLDAIAPVRKWDYSVPTVIVPSRFTSRVPWTESSNFKDKFFENYPVLKEVNFDNLAIAGGAVIDLLLERSPKDIDIFVITESNLGPKEGAQFAKQRIEKFVREIYESLEKKNAFLKETEDKKKLSNPNFRIAKNEFVDTNKFSVQRFRNVYTVKIPNLTVPLQLIASPYESLNHLFERVDLQCTAVGYYKQEVLFSELGKFCFENLAVPLTKTIKNRCQINRLIKYFDKGFDVILPDLDVSKIRSTNFKFGLSEIVDLPYLYIQVSNVQGNKVESSTFTPSHLCNEEDLEDSEGKALYPSRGGLSGGIGIHKNISNLLHGKLEDFIYEGQGPSYKNAFLDRPLLTERMIINTFKTVEQKLFKSGALKLNSVEKFFTVKKLSQILDELLIQYVKSHEASGEQGKILGPKYERYVKEKIEELVKDQIEETKSKLLQLQNLEIPLPSETIESKATCVSTAEWYGEYLKKDDADTHN